MLLQSQLPLLRPQTTAHLAQTMSLLELTSAELKQRIENAIASNPALELIEETRCPHCHRVIPNRSLCPICSRPKTVISDQPIVFISPRSVIMDFEYDDSENENSNDDWATESEDLPTFVFRQIAPELAVEDRSLAAHILSCIDEDGLLTVLPIEIARYNHVPLERIFNIINLIQHAEPLGVGSPTSQAALLVQLDVLNETRNVPKLAYEVVQQGIDLLSRHAYHELAKALNVPTIEAQRIARFITENLNPYPGRAHWGDIHQCGESPHSYQTPDIIITQYSEDSDGPLIVEILAPFSGSLRVNPLFQKALADAPNDKIEQWHEDVDQATLLVKCLQQRNHTLVRLMQLLVVKQRRYILHGDSYLLPITRASLAEELGVHESTISRAVSNKAVQLPNRRIISLSKLFDRSLQIRTALKEIIAHEAEPLSDTIIADLLLKQGFPVARRTVAKYRSMEGILPARLRITKKKYQDNP